MGAIIKLGADKLWLPGQVKPNGVPRIDWSHPLTRGLLFYAFDTGMDSVVDLVSGARGALQLGIVGRSAAANGAGVGYLGPASAQGSYLFHLTQLQGAFTNSSVACGSLTFGTTDVGVTPFSVSGTNYYVDFEEYYATTHISSFNGGPNGARWFGVQNNGNYLSMVCTFDGINANLYGNGSFQDGVACLAAVQSLDNTAQVSMGDYVNGNSGVGIPVNGMVLYGGVWGRLLTPTEITQLHLDPYCFLLPPLGPVQNVMAQVQLMGQVWM
jgi:hypothetical protein